MDIPQTPPSSGEAAQYALRVALQTMKDRCLVLQKRLNTLEEENQQLRSGRDDTKSTLPTASVGFAAENFQLRLQLADLQRQKTQLTEQINMVSTENRKLWSRLSQMAKEQNVKGGDSSEKDQNFALTNYNHGKDQSRNGANSQNNLIRSKTFTQHSPNPNLRLKNISNDDVAETNSRVIDLSLEDIALTTGAGEEMAKLTDSELGFSYLNIDESNFGEYVNINEPDFQLEAKKCTDALQDLKSEALQQQKALQIALTALQIRIAKPPCPECAQKSKKPEMADKSLETDESLSETLQTQTIANASASNTTELENLAPRPINFIQEKINADANAKLKTCPMCGKLYNDSVTFQAFCEHVESHFDFETSDFGSMMEHEFESISSTVGNF